MPGRQSHGRSLTAAPKAAGKRTQQRSKARSNKKALDAFAIASAEYGDKQKRTLRNRELDADVGSGKRAREADDDDDEDEDEDDEGPPRKMRRSARDENGEAVEYGSDSSGNEWQVGVDEDDDDSDIDSDEAFGDSDEDKFQGYSFRGSAKKRAAADDDEDEDSDDDVDGASLGSDAIDLADALDQSTSDDEAEDAQGEEDEDSEDADSESAGSESSEDSSVEDEEDEEIAGDGLKEWAAQFAGEEETEKPETAPSRAKVSIQDLGLLGVKDPQLKKSLKLMNKEERSSKPQKLEVPLARRQQDQLDRVAAYDQTKKTVDSKWKETVKHNRRADHLSFPLAQTETGLARHDNTEIQPLNPKTQESELEQLTFSILEASGLGPAAQQGAENEQDDGEDQQLSRKLLAQQKRRERDLKSREEAKAKRIKKIKSKAYHRVHRRQREREDLKEHEARAAAGEIDSEDEREHQDRQRAMERMGARHRESKWAKMSNKNGRAAWDDDVRLGVADMARRDEELRRRVEGKAGSDESDDDIRSDFSGESDPEVEKKHWLDKLRGVEAEDGEPRSKLMSMAFMQRAEAAKKKANDDMISEIRRELASDDEVVDGSEPDEEEVGRRTYGKPADQIAASLPAEKRRRAKNKELKAELAGMAQSTGQEKSNPLSASTPIYRPPKPTEGAWSSVIPVEDSSGSANRKGDAWSTGARPSRSNRTKKGEAKNVILDLEEDAVADARSESRLPAVAPKPKPKQGTSRQVALDPDDMSDDEDGHMPVQFREHELLEKAFGGLNNVAEFEQEKREIEEEDGDKIIDNTLPGWGSWVGEGVSAREKKRNQGRFLKKEQGVQKKDRKDAKLDRVIINEKRVKKNGKYLASQLPHPYESTLQYERALRLPVGPEWVTKETFQNQTKPKVMIKQGIIKPMEKPMY